MDRYGHCLVESPDMDPQSVMMQANNSGMWVKYSDVKALEEKVEKLRRCVTNYRDYKSRMDKPHGDLNILLEETK